MIEAYVKAPGLDYMKLSDQTRKTVEDILSKTKEKLDSAK